MYEKDEFQCVDLCINGIENLKKANLLLSLYPSLSHTSAKLFFNAVKSVRIAASEADKLLAGGGKNTTEHYYQTKFESSLQKEIIKFKTFLHVKY